MITFCETWLDKHLEQLAYFDNYVPVYKHKIDVKEGGGIAAFIKIGISFKLRYDLSFNDEVTKQFDGLFIELLMENFD